MTRSLFYILIPLAAAMCALSAGCDTSPTGSLGEFRATLYIEGYLRAGSPVDSIFVGTTTPLYETVSRSESGLQNATVAIEVDGATSLLQPISGKPGYYHLPTLQVQPGKTYRLTVETEIGVAGAETTVPLSPAITAPHTELTLDGAAFSATWEGQTAGGYITTRKPQDLGEPIPLENLFFGRFGGGGFGGFGGAIDTTGFAAQRDSLARAEQWRYVQNQSTTLNWVQFSYYGTYAFEVFAIDENYADYLVSSRQDPQFLDEPRFHISGGVGVFASMAPDAVVFTIK